MSREIKFRAWSYKDNSTEFFGAIPLKAVQFKYDYFVCDSCKYGGLPAYLNGKLTASEVNFLENHIENKNIYFDFLNDRFFIKTIEGDMQIVDGSYIIEGIQGEIYACRQDIFEASYVKLDRDRLFLYHFELETFFDITNHEENTDAS